MKHILSGNEAIARGAWEAGVKFASTYPGTPSTEIIENTAKYKEIESQWAANEKVAYEVSYGAALAGVRSLYASKHVGINVAMDPLMTSSYIGINGGFVIVSADDPGMHSSQNEQDNRLIAKFAKIPLIEPSSPAECRTFIKKAYKISEKFDTPVLFRITTRISHTRESIDIEDRIEIKNKPYKCNIPKHVMVPANARKRHVILEDKNKKIKKYSEKSDLNQIYGSNNKIGIITDSISFMYVKEVMPNAKILKLGMPWPFPDEKVQEFALSVDELFIVEELEPFIADEVQKLGIKFTAKDDSFRIGELKPELVRQILNKETKKETKIVGKKPELCKGCPHERAFTFLKENYPNINVLGDIGCYTLGALSPHGMIHTCLCMGASISTFEGFSKILKDKKNIAVIGDSTFFHTGINSLISASYNNTKGIVLILDNSITAMTGGQENPGTGIDAMNNVVNKIKIEELVKACGVDNVDIVNPFEKGAIEKIFNKRINEDKLSVIISRFPCALQMKKELKKKNKNIV